MGMPQIDRRSVVAGLSAATAPPAWLSGAALTVLRLLVGLMWLHNLLWKVPPDFGERSRGGLYFWTHLGVEFPVFAPFGWLLEHVVLPNFTAFGWLTFVVETLLAVLLLTGTAVRLAALIGIGQSAAIGLTVAVAPNEWSWAYAMMVGIHLVLLCTASARYAAVDAVGAATAAGEGQRASRRLLLGWGVVLALVGIAAVIVSSDKAFRAPVGNLVGYADYLEVSVGQQHARRADSVRGRCRDGRWCAAAQPNCGPGCGPTRARCGGVHLCPTGPNGGLAGRDGDDGCRVHVRRSGGGRHRETVDRTAHWHQTD
jgi:hypothetical protein